MFKARSPLRSTAVRVKALSFKPLPTFEMIVFLSACGGQSGGDQNDTNNSGNTPDASGEIAVVDARSGHAWR